MEKRDKDPIPLPPKKRPKYDFSIANILNQTNGKIFSSHGLNLKELSNTLCSTSTNPLHLPLTQI